MESVFAILFHRASAFGMISLRASAFQIFSFSHFVSIKWLDKIVMGLGMFVGVDFGYRVGELGLSQDRAAQGWIFWGCRFERIESRLCGLLFLVRFGGCALGSLERKEFIVGA